jgi:hypothetical protein
MLRTTRSWLVSSLLTSALSTYAASARAEGWLLDGELGVGSGLEGGDPGTGRIRWQRARVRVSAGVELRSDEDADQGYQFRAFSELERRGSVGGEARYVHWPSQKLGIYAGVLGTIAPETLFGGEFGGRYRIGGSGAALYIEPSVSALPLGSDLPGSSPLFWVLLNVGGRFGL